MKWFILFLLICGGAFIATGKRYFRFWVSIQSSIIGAGIILFLMKLSHTFSMFLLFLSGVVGIVFGVLAFIRHEQFICVIAGGIGWVLGEIIGRYLPFPSVFLSVSLALVSFYLMATHRWKYTCLLYTSPSPRD